MCIQLYQKITYAWYLIPTNELNGKKFENKVNPKKKILPALIRVDIIFFAGSICDVSTITSLIKIALTCNVQEVIYF
jgi:hypothetical protein